MCSIKYKCMACSQHCSMCSMSVQTQMQVLFQVQVQCVVYTVQCIGCSGLPAKDEDLAVQTGYFKLKVCFKITSQKQIALTYFLDKLRLFKALALWADAFYKLKCPSVCLWVCVSVCLFTFEVPFKRLFAPTSRSRMSNIFRDSESLGKSNWKKWSNTWRFLFENCLKSRWIRDLWSKGVSLILAYL